MCTCYLHVYIIYVFLHILSRQKTNKHTDRHTYVICHMSYVPWSNHKLFFNMNRELYTPNMGWMTMTGVLCFDHGTYVHFVMEGTLHKMP